MRPRTKKFTQNKYKFFGEQEHKSNVYSKLEESRQNFIYNLNIKLVFTRTGKKNCHVRPNLTVFLFKFHFQKLSDWIKKGSSFAILLIFIVLYC